MISEIRSTDTTRSKRPSPVLLATVGVLTAGAVAGWWMTPKLAVEEDEAPPPPRARLAAMQAYPGSEPQLQVDVRPVQPAVPPAAALTPVPTPTFAPVAVQTPTSASPPVVVAAPPAAPAPLSAPIPEVTVASGPAEPTAARERVTIVGGVPEPIRPSSGGTKFGCDGPYASELIGCSAGDAARARPAADRY